MVAGFITAVVVPTTIWFTMLKVDMRDAKAGILQNTQSITRLETKVEKDKDELNKTLLRFERSLGRIEGQLHTHRKED